MSTYPDLVWCLTPSRHAKFMLEEIDEKMSEYNAVYVFSRLRGDVVTQMSTLALGSHPTLLTLNLAKFLWVGIKRNKSNESKLKLPWHHRYK